VADPAGGPDAIDVLGVGNALVDVLSQASDALVASRGLAKGTMRLVDEVLDVQPGVSARWRCASHSARDAGGSSGSC